MIKGSKQGSATRYRLNTLYFCTVDYNIVSYSSFIFYLSITGMNYLTQFFPITSSTKIVLPSIIYARTTWSSTSNVVRAKYFFNARPVSQFFFHFYESLQIMKSPFKFYYLIREFTGHLNPYKAQSVCV